MIRLTLYGLRSDISLHSCKIQRPWFFFSFVTWNEYSPAFDTTQFVITEVLYAVVRSKDQSNNSNGGYLKQEISDMIKKILIIICFIFYIL